MYRTHKYSAANECEQCDGIIHHEPWCFLVNKNVRYAYKIATDPAKLTAQDTLTLHALGVSYRQLERRDQMSILRGE
jgi:hypothetical protein